MGETQVRDPGWGQPNPESGHSLQGSLTEAIASLVGNQFSRLLACLLDSFEGRDLDVKPDKSPFSGRFYSFIYLLDKLSPYYVHDMV